MKMFTDLPKKEQRAIVKAIASDRMALGFNKAYILSVLKTVYLSTANEVFEYYVSRWNDGDEYIYIPC